jgi:PAS domain S-box-containing protein
MDYSDKTKEELISELKEITKLCKNNKKKYDEEILLVRQTEARAKRSEEIFRKAFLVSPDSVNINRLSDGFFVSVNEGFKKMTGYTEEDVSGKTSVDLNIWVSSEDRSNLVAALETSGKLENFEADFRRKDGSIINGSMSASLIDIDGVPHILNITKDITGSKQIKKELDHERSLIDALINNLTDYIYIKDRDGRFLKINNSQAVLLGLDHPDQVLGKSDKDFFSIEHAGEANNDEQYVVSTGNVVSKEEKLTREGLPDVWVLTTKMALRDADGIIVGSFGISKDITEKKNLEEALHLKQVMLEAIIDNSPDQIYYKDRYSKFLLCNKPVALLAGCESEKDMIGKSDFDFYPKHMAMQYFNDEQKILKIGEPLLNHEEQVVDKKTGEVKWNLSSKVPVRDLKGDVIGLAGFNRDITERKKTEEEIKLKNELLETLNIEKDKFFSIIAHDLRGPLSAFVAATRILEEDIQNMTFEEIRDITISMKTDAANVYQLLENLLEWSRLQRGVMEFHPVNLNLFKVINVSLESVSSLANNKGILIEVSVNDELEINADNHMLSTVVRNMVSNAVKFTPAGGRVTVSAKHKDSNIEISVTDTGIGMTQDMINKLFLMNEKTGRNGTDGEPSSGLGLLLCKDFVGKHGGIIKVESEEGRGSTFSFTMPSAKFI